MAALRRTCLFISILLIISGCETSDQRVEQKKDKSALMSYINSAKSSFPGIFSIETIQGMISDGNLKEASRYVNIALSLSSRNPVLHLINGFIYEEMARAGDGSYTELAGVAYTSAYNLDPTQWYIVYLYGRHMLKKGDYEKAQGLLSEALLLKPDDPEIMHCLAYASYYMKDLAVAAASIEKAASIKQNDPGISRSAAIIFASAGKGEKARHHLNSYKKMIGGDAKQDVDFVQSRVCDWEKAHKKATLQQAASIIEVAGGGGDVSVDVGPQGGDDSIQNAQKEADDALQKAKDDREKAFKDLDGDPNAPAGAKELFAKPKAEKYIPIIIECYILSVDESNSTSKGTNVLDAIADNISFSSSGNQWTKSFQNPINPSYVLPSEADSSQTALGNRQSNTYTKSYNFAISDSGIKYNLNIMNAAAKTVEILGRPTVATMLGEKATFMAGSQVLGGSQSAFSNPLQSVDIGMKVEIVPISITEKNKVVLTITVSGSAMMLPPDSGRALDAQTFSVGKSKTSTTVKAAFDQTVLICGLYQRVQQHGKSQVPLLGDIPIVQYFFANEQTSQTTSTVLYLLTPRRGGVINKCTSTLSAHKVNPNDSVTKRLEERGIVAIGDYVALRYILQSLMSNPLFFDFRTGDLLPPYYGPTCADLNKKIELMMSFLYF